MVQSFDADDPLANYSPSEYLIAEVLAEAAGAALPTSISAWARAGPRRFGQTAWSSFSTLPIRSARKDGFMQA